MQKHEKEPGDPQRPICRQRALCMQGLLQERLKGGNTPTTRNPCPHPPPFGVGDHPTSPFGDSGCRRVRGMCVSDRSKVRFSRGSLLSPSFFSFGAGRCVGTAVFFESAVCTARVHNLKTEEFGVVSPAPSLGCPPRVLCTVHTQTMGDAAAPFIPDFFLRCSEGLTLHRPGLHTGAHTQPS
jgi:hypothetical protein